MRARRAIGLLVAASALGVSSCAAFLSDYTEGQGAADATAEASPSTSDATTAIPDDGSVDSNVAASADAKTNAGDGGDATGSAGRMDATSDVSIDGGQPVDAGPADAASEAEAACTPTGHMNGVGENYESCAPLDTYTPATAMAACVAYAVAIGDNASNCAGPWNCGTTAAVCHGTSDVGGTSGLTCLTYCWTYSGSAVGLVSNCSCPRVSKGTWQ